MRRLLAAIAAVLVLAGCLPDDDRMLYRVHGVGQVGLAEIRNQGWGHMAEAWCLDDDGHLVSMSVWHAERVTYVCGPRPWYLNPDLADRFPTNNYVFLHGPTVRWPCGQVTYRIHGGTQAQHDETREAFRHAEPFTGLTFAELAEGIPNINVRWSTPAEHPHLDNSAGGFALSHGRPHYTTGEIVIDRNVAFTPGHGWGMTRGNLIIHELGHALGLDHSTGHDDLMAGALTPSTSAGFGPGDRSGLRTLYADCL